MKKTLRGKRHIRARKSVSEGRKKRARAYYVKSLDKINDSMKEFDKILSDFVWSFLKEKQAEFSQRLDTIG